MGNTDGFSVTALVLGIVSISISWIPIIGLLTSIVTLIFGIIGLKHINSDASKEGKGFAITGIVLGSLGILIGLMELLGIGLGLARNYVHRVPIR